MPTTFTVEEDYQDSRFDKWFKNNVLDIPHSLIEKFIRLNKVKVNKKRTKTSYRVQVGDFVEVYNIEKLDENKYGITMAVSGFDESDLNIDVKENILSVTGDVSKDDNKEYLHKGIATRNFERSFRLADYVEVESANLLNGLLNIILVRELPEAMKPRKIEISTSKVIEG